METRHTNSIEYSYLYQVNESNFGITRDKDVPNRYWCEYPPEWRTANCKERIVGFRSLFVARSVRTVMFALNFYDFSDKLVKSFPEIFIDLYYDDDCQTFIDKLKLQLGDYSKCIDVKILPLIRIPPPTWNKIYAGQNFDAYFQPPDQVSDALETPYIGIGFAFFITDEYASEMKFIMTDINDKGKSFFNARDYEPDHDPTGKPIPYTTPYNWLLFYNIWDRHSCMIKSNLVNGTMNNYLGYTGVRYSPLKFYRITNSDEKFYVDLYCGHNHKFISVLPDDDLESITMELVFY
jgi:hypothetical protein